MMKPIEYLGQPIGFPGLYHGVPIHRYHSADICVEPSISSSGLRRIIGKSPAHYWDESPYNPDRAQDTESESLILGRATHHLLLGEKAFRKLFCVRPSKWDSWRSKEAREWRAKQAILGFTVLSEEQIDRIQGMAVSLARHPLVRAGILNGAIEQSIFWKDEETGVWLKIRPDAVPSDSADFVDLKTTTDVSHEALRRCIAEYGYNQQGGLVREGVRKVLKLNEITFTLVFVESKRPHCVRIVTLKDVDLDRGERQNRLAIRTFAKCMKEKHWPGPDGDQQDAEYIEMPEWKQKQIDESLNIAGV